MIRLEIQTDRKVPAPLLKLALHPEKAPSLLRLLGTTDARARLLYREAGPAQSPFAGPLLCNGHWLLLRNWSTAKDFDQLLAKAQKLAGVNGSGSFVHKHGDTHEDDDEMPNFESLLARHEHERWAPIVRDFDVVLFHNGAAQGSVHVRPENSGRRFQFDLSYLVPLLGRGYRVLLPIGEDEDASPARLESAGEFVGFLTPQRSGS